MKSNGLKLAAILIIIIGGVVAFFGRPQNVSFWEFKSDDVVRLFTQLILIALIIERALEVMLTPWREPQVKQKSVDLAVCQTRAEQGGEPEKQALVASKKDLAQFKSETQSIAFKASLAVGIIVSLIGIRALYPLVEPNAFGKLPWYQQSAFSAVDVLFTGALLSGGADGLHKILSLFLDYVDNTRERVQARK